MSYKKVSCMDCGYFYVPYPDLYPKENKEENKEEDMSESD